MSLVATLIKRRTFLTRMVLGWLASTSSAKIGAGLALVKGQLASKPQRNGVVFYVAPSGNNAWSGNQPTPNQTKTDGPFATFQRARDAIRELKRQQGDMLKQPVTVFVRAGTYFLDQPLLLQPEDSGTSECPVIFAAFPNENPLISGGKRITNWRKLDGNRWVAQLPEAKAGKWNFRLLRTNNDWAIRARYPKFEPKQPLTGGWLYAKWYGKPWEKGTFNTGVILNNVGDQLEWRILIPAAGDYKVWVRYSHNLEASRDERATMRVGKSQPVRLNNLPSTGGKYQWTQAATVRLVAGEQTLVWENNKIGTFELDAFCLTDDSDWNPETSISIVSGWGKYELQSPKAGHHLLIVQAEACEKAVGKQVKVPKPDLPGVYDRILIDPETFPRFQNWDGAEVHIFPALGWLNTIVKVNSVDKENHTLLVDCEQDIRPGNRFFIANVREALDSPGEWYLDQKAGELIYWPTQPDFPHVEVVAPTMDRLVVLQGDAQTGRFVEHIHFRGFSFTDTDYTLFDSIPESLRSYLRVAIVLSNGKDNIFENNIFVNSVQHQIGLLQLDDYMKGNVFRRNIVVFDNPKADLWKSWAREWKRDPLAECDFNLYWHTGGLDLAKTEQVITPEGNFAKWQAAGFDRNSLIADPRFSNLAKGNFQLKPDSPAFQLGFKPIPIERIATGSSL